MPYYRLVGRVPPKRHTQFRDPNGALYIEEMIGESGFSADSSRLYHENDPVAILGAEAVGETDRDGLRVNRPLLPWHVRTDRLAASGDLVLGRRLLFANDDIDISFVVAASPSDLYRNVAGDEVVFVQTGTMRLESVFGAMDVGPGDYVVIPTGVTHRWIPTSPEARALVMAASGHVAPPSRFLTSSGQFLEGAPYCERDLRSPSELMTVHSDREVAVLVRHGRDLTRFTMMSHPFDVVGWDGCLYPYAFNIRDFEPIVGRFHQPPPVHQTFEGPNFVICSFCPRPFDFDEQAIPVPYVHANVDSDELLFYVSGSFMSRQGVGVVEGSFTLHPAGFTHGPHPGSVEGAIGQPGTDEVAVMVDTFRPLQLAATALECADSDYPLSWAKPKPQHNPPRR